MDPRQPPHPALTGSRQGRPRTSPPILLLLPAVLLVCLLPPAAGTAVPPPAGAAAAVGDAVARLLHAELDAARAAAPPAAVRQHPERAQAWRAMQDLYARRGDQPIWWQQGRPRPAALRLLDALDAAPADGLDPRLCPGQLLRQQIAAVDAAGGATPADAALTYTFLTFAADLSVGRIADAERVRSGWHAQPPSVDLAAALDRALEPDDDVAGALATLTPGAAGYAPRRQAATRSGGTAAGAWLALRPVAIPTSLHP